MQNELRNDGDNDFDTDAAAGDAVVHAFCVGRPNHSAVINVIAEATVNVKIGIELNKEHENGKRE